jgi:hypothetical protein
MPVNMTLNSNGMKRGFLLEEHLPTRTERLLDVFRANERVVAAVS